jgi:hypothetical protein
MPYRHTVTSSHPAFVTFPVWINEKLAEAQAINNTAEVDKINAALQAKEASVADITTISNDINSIVVDKEVPAVPAFNHYFDQWLAEFNVQLTVEEIA